MDSTMIIAYILVTIFLFVLPLVAFVNWMNSRQKQARQATLDRLNMGERIELLRTEDGSYLTIDKNGFDISFQNLHQQIPFSSIVEFKHVGNKYDNYYRLILNPEVFERFPDLSQLQFEQAKAPVGSIFKALYKPAGAVNAGKIELDRENNKLIVHAPFSITNTFRDQAISQYVSQRINPKTERII